MSDESEMFDGVEDYADDDYSFRVLCQDEGSDFIGREDINRLSLRVTRDPDVLHDFLDNESRKTINRAKKLLKPSREERLFLTSVGYRIAELNGQWYAYNSQKNDLMVFNGAYFERNSTILDPDGEHESVHLGVMSHYASGGYEPRTRCKIVGYIDLQSGLERRLKSNGVASDWKIEDELYALDDDLSGKHARVRSSLYGGRLSHPVRQQTMARYSH